MVMDLRNHMKKPVRLKKPTRVWKSEKVTQQSISVTAILVYFGFTWRKSGDCSLLASPYNSLAGLPHFNEQRWGGVDHTSVWGPCCRTSTLEYEALPRQGSARQQFIPVWDRKPENTTCWTGFQGNVSTARSNLTLKVICSREHKPGTKNMVLMSHYWTSVSCSVREHQMIDRWYLPHAVRKS